MEEEYRIVNGFKLPPKRHVVVKRKVSSSPATAGQKIQEAQRNKMSEIADTLSSYEKDPHYEKNPSWNSLRAWRGRISRGDYVAFHVILFILGCLTRVSVVEKLLGFLIISTFGLFGVVLIYLVYLVWCVEARRFHDFGLSGWWALLTICGRLGITIVFAIIGIIQKWDITRMYVVDGIVNVVPFLIIACIAGTHGPNRFGPDNEV